MDDELAFAGPANQGPQTQPGNVPCAVCGARTAMCCSACEAVFYCSPACQQRDWKDHWRVCGTSQAPAASPQQAQGPRARSPGGRSPGGPGESDDGDGYQVALPQSNFAHAAASQAAATSAARDRRLRLRVSAVLAARESRHQDALQHAAEAYEVAQRLGSLYAEGKSMADEGGIAELEGPALVELLIIVRAALAVNDFGTGLGFLEMLTATVDRLAGVGGNPAMLQPSEAASLLYSTSELCSLYNHEERAEDYAHAYLGVVRLAHGEGSKEVGDAHGFLCGLFTRRKRYEEAVLHASSTLKIRQRHAGHGAEKPVADAYWNLAVLQYQLGQHRAALDSLEASREIHVRISGEGVATSNVDLALGQVWTILGEAAKAMRSYRQAVRWRQRTLGFAHAETRRAASLLAASEIEAHAEEEWRKDIEAEAEEEEAAPVARPRPRQRPIEMGDPLDGGEVMMAQNPRALRGEPSHQAAPPFQETPSSSPGVAGFSPGSSSASPATTGGKKPNNKTPHHFHHKGLAHQAFPSTSTTIYVHAGRQMLPVASDHGFAENQAVVIAEGTRHEEVNALKMASSHEELSHASCQLHLKNALKYDHKPGTTVSMIPASEANLTAPTTIIECVAGDSDKPLGFKPASVPPGPVSLKTVDAGSWADRSGLRPGMQLLSINGKAVHAMTTEEFKTSLRTMPVTLRVAPGPIPDTAPTAAKDKAAPSTSATSAESQAAVDAKLGLDGRLSGQLRHPPKGPEQTAAVPSSTTPAASKENKQSQLTTFAVPESTKTIGCLFTSVPPGPVFVRQVDTASWAEEKRIQVGWELVTCNGKVCSEMPADTFRTFMRARPLTLAFNSQAAPPREELNKQGWRPSVTLAGKPSDKGEKAHETSKATSSTKAAPNNQEAEKAEEYVGQYVGQRIEVLRSDGSWSMGTVAEVRPEGLAVRIDGGNQLKKIAASSLKEQVRLCTTPTQASQAGTQRRKETITQIFKMADVDKTGRLNLSRLHKVAAVFGFPEAEEEYRDEYMEFCEDYKMDPQVGIDVDSFEKMLNDKESEEYYRNDQELQQILSKLSA